jgi:hypothetical protein
VPLPQLTSQLKTTPKTEQIANVFQLLLWRMDSGDTMNKDSIAMEQFAA